MKWCSIGMMALLMVVASCKVEEKQKTYSSEDKVKVVCTTGIIGDAVSKIFHNMKNVEITNLMGAGVDPHLYNPTQSDMTALSEADIIIYNGLHLEGKMISTLENLKVRKYVYAVADGIEESQLIKLADFDDAFDPHIWFDVKLWNDGLNAVGDSLLQLFPNDKSQIQTNIANLNTDMDETIAFVKNTIESIPKKHRIMVTAHDAFSYFGKAYGVEVRGLQGISTTAGVAIKDVKELVTFIVDNKVSTIFIESSVPAKALESVIEGCAAKDHDVLIGGTLYSDAMGEEGTPEGTYKGMVEYNVTLMKEAFIRTDSLHALIPAP